MWHWIKNAVHKVVHAVKTAARAVANAITTGVNAIAHAVHSTIGLFFDAIAVLGHFILAIPILGRLIGWAWSAVLTAVWWAASFIDVLLTLLGIMIEKRL